MRIGPVAQQNPVLLTPGLRHHSLLRDSTCIKGANERIVLKVKYAPSKHGGGRQPSDGVKRSIKGEKNPPTPEQSNEGNCQACRVR